MTNTKRTKRTAQTAPTFRELSRADCEKILERNHVGRVAFTFHDHVDIEPVHYVYADGWLHGRTSPGAKIAALRHHPWVAFEVDEIEGLFDWCSVVVHGAVIIPDPDRSPGDREAYEQTLAHVRSLVPESLTSNDPAPERFLPYRIHVDTLTGRAASTH